MRFNLVNIAFLFLTFLPIQFFSEDNSDHLKSNVRNLRSNLKSMGYTIGQERLYAGITNGGRVIFTARIKTSTLPDFIAFGATHDGSVNEFLFTVYEADDKDRIIRKIVSKKVDSEILVELKKENIKNYHLEIEILDNTRDPSIVEVLYGVIYSFSKDIPANKKSEEKPSLINRPASDSEKSGYFQWGKISF
ncbi:MAG: hypothetical protein L6Q54_00030 [Leptospiraceae bacterium]|nr:hypothetical protein [Leptospiraceae bacterium]MCK6379625.1 hypothetical protein [Leptospiraceae bacterium]NUM41601.1 hypothetical protein [Leptospiraceae bacterium]